MLDDPKLMKPLLDSIFKAYGYKSTSVRTAIGKLIDSVREDERKKFAKFFYKLLLENQHSTVSELLDKVKRNDSCRADAFSQ